MQKLKILTLFLFLSACSLQRQEIPTILTKVPDTVQFNKQVTDYDVLVYTQGVKLVLTGRTFRAEQGDLAAALAMAGLSSGATIAGSTGAGGEIVAAIVAVGALLSNAVNTINPAQRANALSEGSNMVLAAEGKYFVTLTSNGIKKVSNRELTPYGAILLDNVNTAITVTNRLLMSTLPSLNDLEKLKPTQPPETPKTTPQDAARINSEVGLEPKTTTP